MERTRFSHEQRAVRIDAATGEPLNPKGCTGISGRGALYLWGANHAADCILTRLNSNTGDFEALLIQRGNGQWAIPGGMVEPGESAAQAAFRELKEEAGISTGSSGKTVELYRGYVDDPRNTNNAWMETVVFYEHTGVVDPRCGIAPTAGSDAKAAKWTPLTRELVDGLYASHPEFVKSALLTLVESPSSDRLSRQKAGDLLGLASKTHE